jgi:hypothetical protein
MKSFTEYLTFTIPGRVGFVNITLRVPETARPSTGWGKVRSQAPVRASGPWRADDHARVTR